MTNTEKKLAAHLLEEASCEYANHGCNDFDLSQFIPDLSERNALVLEIYGEDAADFREVKEGESDYRIPDWLIMSHLAMKLNKETHE